MNSWLVHLRWTMVGTITSWNRCCIPNIRWSYGNMVYPHYISMKNIHVLGKLLVAPTGSFPEIYGNMNAHSSKCLPNRYHWIQRNPEAPAQPTVRRLSQSTCPNQLFQPNTQAQKHPITPQVPPSSPRMPWSHGGSVKLGTSSCRKPLRLVISFTMVSVSNFAQLNDFIEPCLGYSRSW